MKLQHVEKISTTRFQHFEQNYFSLFFAQISMTIYKIKNGTFLYERELNRHILRCFPLNHISSIHSLRRFLVIIVPIK